MDFSKLHAFSCLELAARTSDSEFAVYFNPPPCPSRPPPMASAKSDRFPRQRGPAHRPFKQMALGLWVISPLRVR